MYVVQAVSSQILFENRTLPRHSKNTSIKYESLQVRLMLAIPKIYIMQATVEKNKSYSGTTGFNFLLVDKSDHYVNVTSSFAGVSGSFVFFLPIFLARITRDSQ